MNVKSLIFVATSAALLVAAADCQDLVTGADGLYMPPQIMGDDGRRLLWKPAPGEKQCFEPWFSPDGMKVCASYRSGIYGRDGELAILDLKTGELKVVGDPRWGISRPCWSPTGEWIAYQSRNPSNFGVTLWIVRPDGTDNRKLELGTNWAYSPRWSADGEKIFLVCLAPGEPREPLHAAYYDLTTEELTIIKEPIGEFGFKMAAPSPDGRNVALSLFVSYASLDVVVALAAISGEGMDVRWRAEERGLGEVLDWSPDSKYVLARFNFLNTGVNNLWAYDRERRVVRQVTMSPPGLSLDTTWGCWGPNGDIVFGVDQSPYGGWLYLIKAPE